MSNRVSSISIRTTLKAAENRDILFALRNVLDVVETQVGYIVILEEPVKSEFADPILRAITSFDFVEDVRDVEIQDFKRDHAMVDVEVHKRIIDAINDTAPSLEGTMNDIGQFSAYRREWLIAHRKIYDALYPK